MGFRSVNLIPLSPTFPSGRNPETTDPAGTTADFPISAPEVTMTRLHIQAPEPIRTGFVIRPMSVLNVCDPVVMNVS